MLPKAVSGYTETQILEALKGVYMPPQYRIMCELVDRRLNFIREIKLDSGEILHLRDAPTKRSLTAVIKERQLEFDTYAEIIARLDPTVWLKLDEVSGTTASDSSGNGHTGTYVNTPTLGRESLLKGEPDSKSVLLARTSSEHISVASNAAFNTNTFSACAWIRTSYTGSRQVIAARDNGTTNRQFIFRVLDTPTDGTPGYLQLIAWIGGAQKIFTASINVADGVSHFCAATYDGAFIRLYVDGYIVLETAQTGNLDAATQTLFVGALNAGANFLDGHEQHFILFPRGLTSAEVREMWQSGAADFVEVEYEHDLFRISFEIRMHDDGYAAWKKGVFKPQDFARQIRDDGTYINLTAYDQSWFLANDAFTSRWTIAAGENYLTGTNGILDILRYGGFDPSDWVIEPTTLQLPATIDFEIGDSTLPNLLAVVNKLLTDINYDDLWFDGNGKGVMRSRQEPYNRDSEDSLTADRNSVLDADQLEEGKSLKDAYNVFLLFVASPDRATILTSTGQITKASIRTNIARVGRKPWIEKVEAPDQPTLDAIKERRKTEKSMIYRPIRTRILPLPYYEHNDRVSVFVEELDSEQIETFARRWSLPLTEQGDWMQIELDPVVNPN